jgi:hypothetical protein
VTILIITVFTDLLWIVTPLPFIRITTDSVSFYTFTNADYLGMSDEILSMIILAFSVNLLDNWIPKGKNIFNWFLLRILTVLAGVVVHYLVTWVFHRFLPAEIVHYAPAALLMILIVMLLTGALKFIVGIFAILISAGCFGFLYLSQEWNKKRSFWMTTAAVAIAVCILASMILRFPRPNTYKDIAPDFSAVAEIEKL